MTSPFDQAQITPLGGRRQGISTTFETQPAVVLLETRQVKGALKAMPLKTDRRDAEGIARLLQMGWFRPVHCKSVSAQEMRAILSARKSLRQALVNLELSLRSYAGKWVTGFERAAYRGG